MHEAGWKVELLNFIIAPLVFFFPLANILHMHHHEVGKTFRAIGQCRSSLSPCHTGGNFLLQLGRAEPPKEAAVRSVG
jgi:hypothetical protein